VSSKQTKVPGDSWRILIVFNAGAEIYGMERAVIEIFDLLRPEVEPHFLMSYTTKRLDLPILKEIKQRGFSHSFFSDWTDWPRIGKPKSLRDLWSMSLAMLRGNRDVWKAARGKDFIYIPGFNYFYFAVLASLRHRLLGKRIIYHFHNLAMPSSTGKKFAYAIVTDFIHNTHLGYRAFIDANTYLTKKKHHVIPVPIAAKSNGHIRHLPAAANNGRRSILFVGQVAHHKGVDILLDAFDLLAESHENLVLNIVGGCDDRHLRRRLETEKIGNGCKVKWWGYQDDVGQFLRSAHLYVHPTPPSRCHESFGVGLVEAMSLGIPSICFRSGGFQEIMIHEETGLICEDEQPREFAKSIDRLLRDTDLRNHCGQQAVRRYQEKYSSANIKTSWLEALEQLSEVGS
jgi:glycosyltransferase involved in cell wall biosynthesis